MTTHKLLPLFALALNVLLLASALAGDRRSRRHLAFAALRGLVRLLRAYRALPSIVSRRRADLVIAGVSVSLLGELVDIARFVLGWQHLYSSASRATWCSRSRSASPSCATGSST